MINDQDRSQSFTVHSPFSSGVAKYKVPRVLALNCLLVGGWWLVVGGWWLVVGECLCFVCFVCFVFGLAQVLY